MKLAESQLSKATTELEKTAAFFEYLDLLEANALALRHRLYPAASSELVKDKLIGAVGTISKIQSWRDVIQQGLTTETAYIELRYFVDANEAKIEAVRSL